jgi:hypothetical protein
MPTPTFTPEDLLLGSDVLDQLTSACANQSISDPIARAISTAVGMVDDYTTQYVLTDLRYERLVRALAVYEMYRLAGGGVPQGIEDANKAAVRELEAIRDGKFPDLARVGEAAGSVTSAKGKWGSQAAIPMRGNSTTGS